MVSILADLAVQKPEVEDEKIWTKILQDVSSEANKVSQGSAIVLGDTQSGKTSLIARVVNVDRPHHPSVFEYNFLTVYANEDNRQAYQITSSANLFGTQDHMNLPLWICDGSDDKWKNLYEFAFPKQLNKCVVVLCASFAQPGKILESLERWYDGIEEAIKKCYSQQDIKEAKEAQMKLWQEYVEPAESTYIESPEFKPDLLEPEQGVLTKSCGISVVVALTKADEKAFLTSDDLGRLQWQLRQFCLKHGAALFYTSAKNDTNTELLRKYIAHRVYGAPFTKPAHIVDQSSIFIPSGWDSLKKLDAEREMLTNPEDPLSSTAEETIDSAREKEVKCEEEQEFLQDLSTALAQEVPTPRRDPAVSATAQTAPSANSNQSPLANYFGSLIKQGQQTTNPTQTRTSLGSSNNDNAAASQLFQRMASGR